MFGVEKTLRKIQRFLTISSLKFLFNTDSFMRFLQSFVELSGKFSKIWFLWKQVVFKDILGTAISSLKLQENVISKRLLTKELQKVCRLCIVATIIFTQVALSEKSAL